MTRNLITLIYFFIFFLGASIGSFLNVAAGRWPQGKSVCGRSHCEHCGRKLGFLDLVPLFSFLFLRGRCRTCRQKLSWSYFWVEICTGVLFLLVFLKFLSLEPVKGWDLLALRSFSEGGEIGNFFVLCYLLYVTCLLIIIFLSDLKYYIIPDQALIAGVVGFVVYKIFEFFTLSGVEGWKLLAFHSFSEGGGIGNFILAALISGGFFLALVLISRGKWMGWGDVKLAFLMGLWLGWPNILAALFLAFLSGSLAGLALVAAGKKTIKSQVPFGTFLAASTFVVMLWGQELLRWYWGIII